MLQKWRARAERDGLTQTRSPHFAHEEANPPRQLLFPLPALDDIHASVARYARVASVINELCVAVPL